MFSRDARTVVMYLDPIVPGLHARDDDRMPGGGVLDRILDQIDQHLSDLGVVEAHQRQVGADSDGEGVRPGARRQARRTPTQSPSILYLSFRGRNAPDSIQRYPADCRPGG